MSNFPIMPGHLDILCAGRLQPHLIGVPKNASLGKSELVIFGNFTNFFYQHR